MREAIDKQHAVMASMGERFVLYRMPRMNDEDQARQALSHRGNSQEMRRKFTAAVSQFFEGRAADDPRPADGSRSEPGAATQPRGEEERLVQLASLVARSRSGVERDGARAIELIPSPEAPARIVKVLAQLRAGFLAIGLQAGGADELLLKVAFDCMPVVRRQVLQILVKGDGSATLNELSGQVRCSTTTLRRHLEETLGIGLVVRRDGPT